MYLVDLRKNKITNQRGNAVFAVLSSVVVLGAFLQVTGFEKIAQGNSVITSSRAKSSRDAIAYQIERYSNLPATFRNSLTSNDNLALQNCILGTGVVACNGDGTEYPLNLYSPTAPVQRISGPGPVTSNQPVLYDTKGNLCPAGGTSATLSCPFEVFTSFTATCPIAIGSPCPKAESITVHYIIRTPQNLFSYSGGSSLAVLGTPIDKFAAKVNTSAILPPAFGYIPNPINVVSLIPLTVVTTTTSDLERSLAEILKVAGGDQALADKIGADIINSRLITDETVIREFAKLWLQNPEAARALKNTIQWRFKNWAYYTVNNLDIMGMAEAISEISDPTLAAEVVVSATTDIPKANAIANALTGITDPRSRLAIAFGEISDPVISQAVQTAIVEYDLPQEMANALAASAMGRGISDVTTLRAYAKLIVDSGITWFWNVIDLVNQGITTVAGAKQLITDSIVAGSAAAAAVAATPTTTAITTTTVIVPANLTAACKDAATCATTLGM